MSQVFVHPQAVVESDQVGDFTRIWAFAHVMPGARIGKNCNIGDHCFIEGGACIGDNVTLKNGDMLWEGVTLEDGVFVAPHVFFTNDLYPRSPRLPEARARYQDKANWLVPTLVKRGASLGAGAIILAGVTIGEFALVGAGALVSQDVAAYALVRGNPARPAGWVCQCGKPLRQGAGGYTCMVCGIQYVATEDGIRPQTKS